MLKLKSTTQAPPGGWLYEQKETGWVSHLVSPSSQWDFQLLCRELQAHRRANPRFKLNTAMPAIQGEVMIVNTARVAAMPNTESYLMDVGGAAPSFPQAPTNSLQALAAVGANLKTGKDVLFDWDDSGQPPVAQELANKRAAICVTCPQNGSGGLSRYFTVPVAALITARFEKLHQMKMETPSDNQLGVCDACLCPLRLKVWTPMEFISKHTTPEQRSKFQQDNPRCWVLQESEPITKESA